MVTMSSRVVARLVSSCAVSMLLAGATIAAPFSSSDHLVAIGLGTGDDYVPFAAQSVHLDEFDVSNTTPVLQQSINLPSSGTSAVTLPDFSNHDGLLHRSVDGRYLVFGGYRGNIGLADIQL